MTDQEFYRAISRALRNQVIHRTTFSLMALIVCRNLFVPVKYTRFSTAPIQRLCLAMNVLMSVCAVIMLMRGTAYEACVIFGITFSTLYVATISFLGFFLLTKTYYASNYHKALLAALLFVQLVVVGLHIHAVTQSSFSNENGEMLCGFTQDQRSFTIALVSEVVYNLFVTALFLYQIHRASNWVRSTLYTILIRNGLIYWLVTATFAVIIGIASVIETGSEGLPIVSVLYIIVGSSVITWQVYRRIRQNHQRALTKF